MHGGWSYVLGELCFQRYYFVTHVLWFKDNLSFKNPTIILQFCCYSVHVPMGPWCFNGPGPTAFDDRSAIPWPEDQRSFFTVDPGRGGESWSQPAFGGQGKGTCYQPNDAVLVGSQIANNSARYLQKSKMESKSISIKSLCIMLWIWYYTHK